jgi:predicted esterase
MSSRGRLGSPEPADRFPALRIRSARGAVRAIVLVLNGGSATSRRPAHRWNLAYLRMVPFAWIVHRDRRAYGVAVWQLRYRVRGWNRDARDPVADAEWALAVAAREHPGVPVILVGHSMGGRTALYASANDAVTGVIALAPWIEPGDPYAHLAGRALVVAHGDQDRITDPAASRRYAGQADGAGARVAHFVVVGEAHAMTRRAGTWHRLVRDAVRCLLGAPDGGDVAEVMAAGRSRRFEVPLPRPAGDAAPAARM